jgi:hypothetical protein
VALPPEIVPQARKNLWALIAYYGHLGKHWTFFLRCVRTFLSYYCSTLPLTEREAHAVIGWLKRCNAELLAGEVKHLIEPLSATDGFAELLINTLAKVRSAGGQSTSDVLEAVMKLADNVVQIYADAVALIASQPDCNHVVAIRLLERLTMASCYDAALRVADALVNNRPDTTEHRPARLEFERIRLAVRYEQALSQQEPGQKLGELAIQWGTLTAQLNQDRIDNAQRRGIFPLIPRPHAPGVGPGRGGDNA